MQLKIKSLESKFIDSKEEMKNLLLLVHGRGGNIRALEFLSKRFQIPSLAYLLVQAPYPEQREDQRARGESGFSWYLSNYSGVEGVRAKIQALLEELETSGLKKSQLYWLGFSQGGLMGLDTFLRSDEVFGGGVFVSGKLMRPQEYPTHFGKAAKNQRILITHGPRDDIITLEDAQNSYDILRKEGVPFEMKIFDKPHSFHLSQEVPYIETRLKDWMQIQ